MYFGGGIDIGVGRLLGAVVSPKTERGHNALSTEILNIASAVVLGAAMGLTLLAPSVANAESSPGFRSPSIVVGGGFGAADQDESASYGLLVTGSFRLFLTRSLAIEADVTGIFSPYTDYADEDTEWSVGAGLVARTPPRRVSAFGSGGFSTKGFYFGGGGSFRPLHLAVHRGHPLRRALTAD